MTTQEFINKTGLTPVYLDRNDDNKPTLFECHHENLTNALDWSDGFKNQHGEIFWSKLNYLDRNPMIAADVFDEMLGH